MINGKEAGTNNYSLYSSGTINLSNTINLQTGSGMYATSVSQVATLDNSTDTITVASGNSCIIDGTLQIDSNTGTFGSLVVNCDTLTFGGTLVVAVDGIASNTCDQLIVNGALGIDPTTSSLNVEEAVPTNGTPESWTIITSTGGTINDFGTSNASKLGMTDHPNDPSPGDYTLSYP